MQTFTRISSFARSVSSQRVRPGSVREALRARRSRLRVEPLDRDEMLIHAELPRQSWRPASTGQGRT
jgi:hypothetical protein